MLTRMLEFDVSLSEIEQTFLAVVAQRLVAVKCPFCEDECSPHCKKMRKTKRLGIFEMLYGKNLSLALKEARGEDVECDYTTLKDVIKKGIALGYLTTHSMHKWIYQYED